MLVLHCTCSEEGLKVIQPCTQTPHQHQSTCGAVTRLRCWARSALALLPPLLRAARLWLRRLALLPAWCSALLRLAAGKELLHLRWPVRLAAFQPSAAFRRLPSACTTSAPRPWAHLRLHVGRGARAVLPRRRRDVHQAAAAGVGAATRGEGVAAGHIVNGHACDLQGEADAGSISSLIASCRRVPRAHA